VFFIELDLIVTLEPEAMVTIEPEAVVVIEPEAYLLVAFGAFGRTPDCMISVALTGISPKAPAVSVKEESEDPNYCVYNVQGNAALEP
jgi:hypothetical protein